MILNISYTTSFDFFQYYTAAFLENLKSRIGKE